VAAMAGPRRNVVLVAVIALMLVVSAGLAYGIRIDVKPPLEVERALTDLRATPLVGLAMRDNPDAATRIRSEIEQDLRHPVAPGVPSRALYAVGELSRDFIRPMLAAADDASVVAVLAARYALATHMHGVDPEACREFAMNGIQRIDRLDIESQNLFKAFVAAMEVAYKDGRAAGGKAQPTASAGEMVRMLNQTGFTQADLDDLNRFAALPALRACEIDLKIDGAPPNLPLPQRAPFARYVLTH
jgi:hypothetical protein